MPKTSAIVPIERIESRILLIRDVCIVSNIFQSKGVVLLVGDKANDLASAERNCSLTQSHRKTANLLTFVAKKNILDGSYCYLHNRLASL
jgi:hypothetical protein